MLCSELHASRQAAFNTAALTNRRSKRRSGAFGAACCCSKISKGSRHIDPGEITVAHVSPRTAPKTRFHSTTPRWPTVKTDVGRSVLVVSVHSHANESIGKCKKVIGSPGRLRT